MADGNEQSQDLDGGSRAFRGPVFVVGMPRSGTKLLRELLNRHSEIAIPPNETHFLPYLFRRRDTYGPLDHRDNFELFYGDVTKSAFFQRLTERQQRIDGDGWFAEIEDGSFAGAVEAMYRHYAKRAGKRIYGDKTPSYMVHLPLLAGQFPRARFLHIVRDPRDQCVSTRKAWGKNIIRAAQRWNDEVGVCRADARVHAPRRYLEVRYEDLLSDPDSTMRRLCTFLGVTFESAMLTLERPAEAIGDARGAAHIVASNTGKWDRSLDPREVTAIERIAGAMMVELGYAPRYAVGAQRVGAWRMRAYKALDGVNLMRRHLARGPGVMSTIRWAMRERTHSAFRGLAR